LLEWHLNLDQQELHLNLCANAQGNKHSMRLLLDIMQQCVQAISHITKKRECVESIAVETSAVKIWQQESRMRHNNSELQMKKNAMQNWGSILPIQRSHSHSSYIHARSWRGRV